MNNSKSKPPKAYFEIAEIAERWRSSERTVRRLIKRGDLTAHRFGNAVRISSEDLESCEKQQRD